jgi:1,4-dihydroxy-2-naphthoyl-CoA hydrolase
MHDTDMAGILYFPRQFRFAHDALEDFVESEGMNFYDVFNKGKFIFVIVHCEADYYIPLRVGDELNIQVSVERIGTSSFTILYEIYKTDHTHAGTAKTIHVTLERESRKKIPIPSKLRKSLEKHLVSDLSNP